MNLVKVHGFIHCVPRIRTASLKISLIQCNQQKHTDSFWAFYRLCTGAFCVFREGDKKSESLEWNYFLQQWWASNPKPTRNTVKSYILLAVKKNCFHVCSIKFKFEYTSKIDIWNKSMLWFRRPRRFFWRKNTEVKNKNLCLRQLAGVCCS